jgi:hypothetical protein
VIIVAAEQLAVTMHHASRRPVHDAVRAQPTMAFEGTLACPRVCVPYSDCMVIRAAEQLIAMHH